MLELGSSKRRLIVAVCIAVVAHAAFLSIKIMLPVNGVSTDETLSVSLAEEPITVEQEQTKEDQQREEPQAVSSITPANPAKPISQDIIVSPSSKETEQDIRIEISPLSQSFKTWLQSETGSYNAANPEAVNEFNNTFRPAVAYTSPPELSPYNGNPVPRSSANFATEVDGKRTCFVKIMNLSDISAAPSFVDKDCTPSEKFELNMNQPNNGWAER